MKGLLNKIEQLLNLKTPFVAYRKPSEKLVTLMKQQDEVAYYLDNYDQKGFIFAPFDAGEKTILFPLERCQIITTVVPDLQNDLKFNKNKDKGFSLDSTSKSNHINLVKKGIDFLQKEQAEKVVLSRKETISIDLLSISDIFNRLIQSYPMAFVSVCYHPKVGLWMGATPEMLLKINGNNFRTMALAGTQIYKDKKEVEWGKKEKEEQQIVTDFILNQLAGFKLKTSKPFTKKAGSLLHICTEISGKIRTSNQLEVLIHKLHPTPAVCGLPKEIAKSFILKNEGYKREFYAGFLGELNINNASELFVNLRCMQLGEHVANLYIGGGITIESDPKSEWEETVAKSEVIKRVLF